MESVVAPSHFCFSFLEWFAIGDRCVMPRAPRKDLDLVAQEISASITRQIGRFFFQNVRITTVFAVIRAFHMGG